MVEFFDKAKPFKPSKMPKPANKKKKFIDKKREETVTFSLIHRSQKDPLAADDEAPQMVLLPIGESSAPGGGVDLTKVKEEEREHGVFYEDDYNYMQHMKDLAKPEYDYSEVDRSADFFGLNLKTVF